jgi:hypothetical protein
MKVLFIFGGRGILVPLYLLISFVGCAILSSVLKDYAGSIFALRYDFQIVIGIALLISGSWCHLTKNDYITVNGKKEQIYLNNHFFFLSLKIWSYIFFYAGLLILIGGIIETLQK